MALSRYQIISMLQNIIFNKIINRNCYSEFAATYDCVKIVLFHRNFDMSYNILLVTVAGEMIFKSLCHESCCKHHGLVMWSRKEGGREQTSWIVYVHRVYTTIAVEPDPCSQTVTLTCKLWFSVAQGKGVPNFTFVVVNSCFYYNLPKPY